MKWFIILLSALFIFSCTEGPSDNSSGDSTTSGTTETEETGDDATDTEESSNKTSLNLSGSIEDGKCDGGADVYIFPLNSANLNQFGAYFQGLTDSNGGYGIPAEIDLDINPQGEIFTEAACDNEITGATMGEKTYRAIIDFTLSENNNVNPATTATVPRLRHLFNSGSNFSSSRQQAEEEYLAIHNIALSTYTPFSDSSVDGETDIDSAMLAMTLTHLQDNNTETEQEDFLAQLADDLEVDGDIGAVLSDKIKNNQMNIDLVKVKDNLNSQLSGRGLSSQSAKFWNFLDSHGNGQLNKDNPQSFVNIIDNKPTINYTFNLSESCSSGFDTSDNRFFAFPYVFDEDVASDFIGINITGEYLSIYDNDDKGDGDHNNDQPGTAIITSSKMPHNFFQGTFEDIELNEYSDLPSELHVGLEYSFTAGTKIWFVVWSDENYRPFMGCPVGLVPFARNLHSVDGVNWIGSDQNGTTYKGSKIKMFTTE